MRPAIDFLTTLAVVIHFTFGCCLHASHFGGPDACCAGRRIVGDQAPDDVDACCNGREHGHEHAHDSTASAAECPDPDPGFAHPESRIAAAGCGCEGCSCAATTLETGHEACGSTAVCWIGHVLDAPSPGLTSPRATPVGEPPPGTSALRSPLFERLLV